MSTMAQVPAFEELLPVAESSCSLQNSSASSTAKATLFTAPESHAFSGERTSLYEPLDPSKRQFRLLKLRSHIQNDQPISCHLRSFSLDNARSSRKATRQLRNARSLISVPNEAPIEASPDFETFFKQRYQRYVNTHREHLEVVRNLAEHLHRQYQRDADGELPFGFDAVSYCWGSDQSSATILVNGHEFTIKPTVHDFLVQKQKGRYADWFFIDSICINQADVQERQSQVMLMGQIYQKADNVVGWLYSTHVRNDCSDIFRPIVDLAIASINYSWYQRELADSIDSAIVSIYAICRDPYWSRVWVTQEILLAHNFVIECGSAATSWSNVLEAIGTIYDLIRARGGEDADRLTDFDELVGIHTFTDADSNNEIYRMFQVWRLLKYKRDADQGLHSVGDMSLRAAVTSFGYRQCSQWHDKIFGLLGLTRSVMKVDYAMDISELYVRTLAESLTSIHRGPYSEGPDGSSSRVDLFSLLDALLEAFGLDEKEPAMIFLTQQVLRCIGAPFVPEHSHRTLRKGFVVLWATRANIMSWSGWIAYCSWNPICYVRSRLLLLWYRYSGVPFSITRDGAQSRTYSEWIDFVTSTVSDVKQRLLELECEQARGV